MVPYKFYIFFISVKKMPFGILTEIYLNIKMALNSMDILIILILIHECGILSICVFFNFFHCCLIVFSVNCLI